MTKNVYKIFSYKKVFPNGIGEMPLSNETAALRDQKFTILYDDCCYIIRVFILLTVPLAYNTLQNLLQPLPQCCSTSPVLFGPTCG